MLTIVTFLWVGWRPVYTIEHVNALSRMVKANCSVPHRFVCITNVEEEETKFECDTFPIWAFPKVEQLKRQNSYVRLKLFDPATQKLLGASSILSIDLDSVILRDLVPLLPKGNFAGVRGVSAPINGSMFYVLAGHHANVWRNFDPKKAPERIAKFKHNGDNIGGSDQAWISMMVPKPFTWGEEHGVLQYSRLPKIVEPVGMSLTRDTKLVKNGPGYVRVPKLAARKLEVNKDARIVFFAGRVKPWDDECKECALSLHNEYRKYL